MAQDRSSLIDPEKYAEAFAKPLHNGDDNNNGEYSLGSIFILERLVQRVWARK